MEPLTTQTFHGDETPAPTRSAGSVTALSAAAGPGAEPGSDAAGPATDSAAAGGGALAVPFRDLGLSEAICSGLEAAGIFTTFPIQALTLPLALRGQDIIGQARTGTGKTLAFGIPLLRLIEQGSAAGNGAAGNGAAGDGAAGDGAAPVRGRAPQALVVVPTRELAIQV